MRGMNSESVDLVYLDPPFNSNANYAAPIGSEAAGAEFKDIWTLQDVDIAWLDLIEAKHKKLHQVIQAAMTSSDKSYLVYMSVRLLEMHRLLKPAGSIYLHCDPTMSHYLKLAMDAIFGRGNFRNEIVYQRYSGRAKGSQHESKAFGTDNDNILFYAQSNKTPLKPFRKLTETEIRKRYPNIDSRGRRYTGIAHFCGINMGDRPNLCYEWRGYVNPHPSGWRVTKERLESEYQDGKVVIHENGRLERRRFYDPEKGMTIGSLWADIQPPADSEQTGYPTQKPLALLKRIIKASCPEDGIVFDPFCGCATTCVAAEIEGREWVGIDIGPKAYDLVKARLDREIGLSTFKTCINRTDIPQRTDVVPLKRYSHPDNKKFLYGEQAGICNGCGHHFLIRNFTVDHIIPQSKGGTDHLENLQLLCGNCNSVKGDRGQEYLIAKLAA